MRKIQARYRQWVRNEIPLLEGQAVIEDMFAEGQSLRDFAREDAAR